MSMFDEEPKFDKKHVPTNIASVAYQSSHGQTLVEVFMLGEDGRPCQKKYSNGLCIEHTSWNSIEEMKTKLDMERQIFDEFYAWMKEYEKNKAKIISIDK